MMPQCKFCRRTSNDATLPEITINFCRIWAILAVGPMYLAISTTAPFSDCRLLSWTTDSR